MRTFLAYSVLGLIAVPAMTHAQDPYICPSSSPEIQQLRLYEINRGNREAFHRRFRDQALPIMRRHGFKIVDMWESDTGERLEFAYVLVWPDRATMELSWNEFLANEQWVEIKRRTAAESGELVREVIRSQPLIRVSYSPACSPK